ncbi:MAG: DUF748 domain-containing protein [Burkholderiales bacterium]|nr:DUF748 domain-containing protein [Burkholderiales bacterium]
MRLKTLAATSLALGALLLLLYALIGFLVLPAYVERELPRQAQARLGISVDVAGVRFNPFLLAFEAHDVRLAQPDGRPLASAQHIAADLRWSSLIGRSWRFDSLVVDAPTIDLVVERDGQLNVARLMAGRKPQQTAAPRTLTDLHVGKLVLRHGTVHFTDHTLPAPRTHSLQWVDVELDRLSTRMDEHGDLLASAVLPRGGALATRARLSLQPVAASGVLHISELNAALPWSLLTAADGAPPRGCIDADLRYDFAYRDQAAALRLSAIGVRAQDLALYETGKEASPALALHRVELRDGHFDLARRELVLPELRLLHGAVRTQVGEDGTLNWQRLFAVRKQTPRSGGPPHLDLTIERLQLEKVDVDYVDRSRVQPLQVAAKAMAGSAALALSLGGERMQFAGRKLDLTGESLVVRAHGSRATPALSSARVSLRDARFDFAERILALPDVTLERGSALFDVGADGALNWQTLFASAAPPRAHATAVSIPEPAGDPRSWRILLPRLRANGLAFNMNDRTRVHPLAVRAASVGGTVDLAITPGAAAGTISLDNIRLQGRNVMVGAAGAGAEPALRVAAVETRGGHLKQQDLLLSGLRLRGGQVRVRVDADGQSNWQQLTAGRTPGAVTAARADRNGAARWRVRLPGLRVNDLALRYRDATRLSPLALESDAITAALDLVADTGARDPLRAEHMRVQLQGVRLGAEGQPSALQLAQVQADGGALHARDLRFTRVRLADGELALAIAEDGSIDLQRLFSARAPTELSAAESVPSPAAAGARPWRVQAQRLELEALQLAARDRSRAAPLALDVAQIAGTMQLDALGSAVQVNDLALQAGPVAVRETDAQDALARLQSLRITGGAIDTGARRIGARTLALSGGATALTRTAGGGIDLLRTLTPATPDANAAVAGRRADASAWRYQLGALQVADVDVALADHGFGAPIAYDVRVDGSLRNFDSAGSTRAAFDLGLRTRQGGKAALSGRLAGAADPFEAKIEIDGLHLEPLQPLIAHYAALDLKSGALGASLVLSAEAAQRGGGVRVSGRADLDDLLLVETKTGDRFLAWKRLRLQPVNFDSASRRLVVGQALLEQPQARLEISREGELNFKQVLRDSARANGAAGPRNPARTADAQNADDGFVALVDRLRIRAGTLRFSDRSLVLPFTTDITQFEGTMVSLSNRREDRAQLQADGRVQPFGAARVRGSIQLADPRAFTDIRAEFNNVPLPKLSPYTITFAGRAVAEGRLWLDLHYRIVDSVLIGENAITMQDLRLGERVAGRRAVDLPLELAAALLTNEQGQLSVRVPVRGDLDNPAFDYRTVIRAAVTNTLRKVATAPLRFIGRLFGPDVEALDSIEFEPGSAALRPPEEEKLNVVAQSLAERPMLALEVRGSYASEEDARALRARALEDVLARGMKLELGEGERLGPIAFGQAATQIVLEQLFAAQFGNDAAEALRAEMARAAEDGRAIRRVDRKAGDPIAAAGDPDLYRAMFDRLVERQPLDAAALGQLASARTQAVLDYVVRQAGVAEQRLSVGASVAVRVKEAALVPTRLRLRAAHTGKDIPLRLETVDRPQPEERAAAPGSAAAAAS